MTEELETLKTIESLKAYQPLLDDFSSKSLADRRKKFFEEILPEYWGLFHRRTNAYLAAKGKELPNYDVGIFLVVLSEIPVLFSVASLCPQKIHFIFTPESESTLNVVEKGIGVINSELQGLIKSAGRHPINNMAKLYNGTQNELSSILHECQDQKIALDITGGKKSMICAVVRSPATRTCDLYYVDFLRYEKNRGRPVLGTEFMTCLTSTGSVEAFIDEKKEWLQN